MKYFSCNKQCDMYSLALICIDYFYELFRVRSGTL